MAEFRLPPREQFEHRQVLIAMLDLLRNLFMEIWQDRERLLPEGFRDPPPALEVALRDIRELIEIVAKLDAPIDLLDRYGLRGEPLYFKMQVIAFANDRIPEARNRPLERVSDGRYPVWGFYRKAVRGTLATIDVPLESLTKMLGIKEGLVEFKKALELLLELEF